MLYTSFPAWINRLFSCMGGCFGSCNKSTNVVLVKGRSRGLLNSFDNADASDEFWTSSAYDIDASTASMSQRSLSLLSTSNQNLQCDLGLIPEDSHSEFVNHGLILWNQNRAQWCAVKKKSNQSRKPKERCISMSATYDSLLETKKPFRKPIPLAEMVEFLVDIWDEEGLDD